MEGNRKQDQLLLSRQELLYPSYFISVFNHVLLYCNQAATLDHLSLKNKKKFLLVSRFQSKTKK